MMMNERELLVDVLQRLNRVGVPYMLTGSMASNFWGIPRTTHDIDIVILLPPGKVAKLTEVLTGDFHIEEDSIRAAYKPPHQFNAIDHRSAMKIDFWMLRDDEFEREMFSRKVRETLFGEPAWISTPEDTILHKLYWNRLTPSERQLGDAVGVFAVQAGELEMDYMRRWAGQLLVTKELAALEAGQLLPKKT